jgi:hypothetical protein
VVQRKLNGLVEAIADGLRAPDLQRRLDELVSCRAEIQRMMSTAPSPAPRLHPALADTYRQKVADLQTVLHGPSGVEALEVARDLIDRVVLHPAAAGVGFEIELVGAIASMMDLALDGGAKRSWSDRSLFLRSVKVVAGTRNTRSRRDGTGDPENSESPVSLVAGGRNTRLLRNAKGDPSGSPSLVSQESLVAGARNTRFLRLVERAIPKLAA